ncbi:KH domain-containing protein [Streptococcus danieliae]|nr:KH domain-containing protein [Gemella sp. GL1.1]MBF0746628.1 KH domain-containing protein [Gemella sp. 19428wG2_WT2a]MBF0848652.1 KH domain-containing protein [Streptococcus danieliae]NYS28146.1 KH domain-containing protein [Gemella sp. GL1]TFU60099.1 KH domain-containing protein [Gemella sp. WT2a]
MEELILNIVKEIVEYKDEVKVDKYIKNAREHYVLSLHPDDVGRVIGKKGMTINAIRTVINSTNFSKKVYLNILE